MKTTYFFSIFTFLASMFLLNHSMAQPCPSGDITFTTQQEIDDFAMNYPLCTEILGNVIFDGSDITSFSGLSQLTSIGGNLETVSSSSVDFAGLEGLIFIGGDLTSNGLCISNFSGLDNLTFIGGNLTAGCFGYTHLENLTSIGGNLEVIGLTNIIQNPYYGFDGLDNLTSIGGNLVVTYNIDVSFDALQNLQSIGGNLVIQGNYFGVDEDGGFFYIGTSGLDFQSLTSVGGDLEIIDSGMMENLNGLNNLTSIGGDLRIRDNGFEFEDDSGQTGFAIRGGLNSLSALNNLTFIGGNLEIEWNGYLINDALFPLLNVPSLGGNLVIKGNNLSSLSGLNNLTSINGTLEISNNALNSISSLENIDHTTITDLQIQDNEFLSVCGLNNICAYLNGSGPRIISGNASGCASEEEVLSDCLPCPPGDITFMTQQEIDDFPVNYPECTEIPGNVTITADVGSLNGLSQLISIVGDLVIDNPSLFYDLSGLNNLTSIGGSLVLEQTYLSSLTGLNNLSSLGGGLVINRNIWLNDLTGLENITSISGDVIISMNFADDVGVPIGLGWLSGLDNLTSIDGNLEITDNGNLYSLSGLNNLTSIGGSLEISTNSFIMYGIFTFDEEVDELVGLSDLSGLENLYSVGGSLTIRDNEALADLSALTKLTYIGGSLEVSENSYFYYDYDYYYNYELRSGGLKNLLGLHNIDHITITDLQIYDNEFLSVCGLDNICAYLNDGGSNTIYGNAADCTSEEEILDGCQCRMTTDFSETFDEDLLIDGVGFENNPGITFTDTNTPPGALLSNISLELYFRLNGASCENEIIVQITEPSGNIQYRTTFTTCDGGAGLYYVELDTPSGSIAGSARDWLIEFDDINDQNTDHEYSVRFARLNYTTTAGGSTGGIIVDEVVEEADMDFSIDGLGFDNNPNITFPAPPANAILSDISLELFFRLNDNSCENEINLQITDPTGDTQDLTPFLTCDGGMGLYYVNIDVASVSSTSNTSDWRIEFDDNNDQNIDYEYSVRFARLSYTTTVIDDSNPFVITDEVIEAVDMDLSIDGVGFTNNPNLTFTDPGTPTDAILSDILLEVYFRLNGNSCENEIAMQLTDPAGNIQPLTAFATCEGGTDLYYANLNVPSGNTTGSVADWLLEFDDTNDQNANHEYSVRFARLVYTSQYNNLCNTEMMIAKNNNQSQYIISKVASQKNPIKLYPVPANQHLNVEYFSVNTRSTNIVILSSEGKTLMSQQQFLQEGMNTIQLDIAAIPSGHYHIRVYNADNIQMKSFVKITP